MELTRCLTLSRAPLRRVNWAIQDGRTNWLEGLTLMALYVIIALVFWWYDPPVF